MRDVTWYFDFISPYAYLGFHTLERLPADTSLRYQPVLFAGLLNHWGQKGPAEIPPKRVWTYRSCIWWAKQNNVPFRMPAAHPFNSLPFLRLSIAAGNSADAIRAIFTALWTTRADPADSVIIETLAETLGVHREHFTNFSVKNALRECTEQATRKGVFGVPTFGIDEQLFWGSDAVDFAAAYLTDASVLATEEIKRADSLPFGQSRLGSN
jgi:2-hydroxychromene-2-carboxylate isomerase